MRRTLDISLSQWIRRQDSRIIPRRAFVTFGLFNAFATSFCLRSKERQIEFSCLHKSVMACYVQQELRVTQEKGI